MIETVTMEQDYVVHQLSFCCGHSSQEFPQSFSPFTGPFPFFFFFLLVISAFFRDGYLYADSYYGHTFLVSRHFHARSVI